MVKLLQSKIHLTNIYCIIEGVYVKWGIPHFYVFEKNVIKVCFKPQKRFFFGMILRIKNTFFPLLIRSKIFINKYKIEVFCLKKNLNKHACVVVASL